ncbi:MAG: glycoside hydrolase [Tannerella sp.]|nr:glycoside hydrolase [Tannerella sp.]
MKNLLFLLFAFLSVSCSTVGADKCSEKVVLAYVTGNGRGLPDPSLMTHINFAFGHVNKTFNGIVISREERLKEIVGLKAKNKSLKVLLSIGGWTSGGFSEMASSEATRKSFAEDCRRVIDEFGLDGIDMDWEYPSSSAAGISSSPDDVDNFSLLMKDIRQAIGKEKMLTLATIADAKHVDFRAIDPYIDLVNIMAYDVARPPHHHSGLFRSEHSGRITSAEAVEAHLKAGVPADKLVLGLPFYGHGTDGLPDFIDYKDIIKLEKYSKQWDDVAKIPYMTNDEGKLVLCYEDSASIAFKCNYIIANGLRGLMYWEYNCDDSDLTLTKAVYSGLYH